MARSYYSKSSSFRDPICKNCGEYKGKHLNLVEGLVCSPRRICFPKGGLEVPARHILLEIERPTTPKPTIVFDLRRHLQPTAVKNLEKLYLTAKFEEDRDVQYPIKIDGATGKIYIRRRIIEEHLGFELVIEER